MAVTSATSTGINVPEIVTGLMEVERQPVKKLETQIDQKTLEISTLGVFKSKASALESAAKAIQTAGVFSLRSTTSSDATKVSATASNAATKGAYSVKVAQTAQSETSMIGGFASASQVVDLSAFSLTAKLGAASPVTYSPSYARVGALTYSAGDKILFTAKGGAEQSFTVTTQTTTAAVASAINAAVTAGTLTDVTASVDASGYLQISSSNPLRGLTASLQIPGYASFSSGATFASGDVIRFTTSGASEQTFVVTSQNTATKVASAINDAVTAGSLSGVTASVVGGALRITAKASTASVSATQNGSGAGITSTAAAGASVVNTLAGTTTAKSGATGGKLLISPVSIAAGDQIKFTLEGGAEQTLTLTTETSLANIKTLLDAQAGISTVIVDGKIEVTSTDSTKDISGSYIDNIAGVGTVSTGLSTKATVSNVAGWINDLKADLEATVVQRSDGRYALNVASKLTGAANAFSITGIGTPDAQKDAITLSGTFSVDDAVVLTVNGEPLTYKVVANDLTADGIGGAAVSGSSATAYKNIAAKIAQAYNASASANHSPVTATADAAVITLTADAAGTAFTSGSQVLKKAASAWTATANAASVAQIDKIELSGKYAAGDVISLTVNGVALSYTVTSANITDGGGSAADHGRIATALAAAYNASTNSAHTPITAGTSGAVVTLTADAPGTAFTASSSVTPLGPVAIRAASVANSTSPATAQVDTIALSGKYTAGDVLKVTVGGVALDYTVTAADVVGGGSASADFERIAQSFTAAYNASTNAAHTPVTASYSGGVISLTADTAGTAFLAAASVTRVAVASGAASKAAVVANVADRGLTAVGVGAIGGGTISNGTYTATYDGAAWVVSAPSGTFTASLASGTLTFASGPDSFTVSSVVGTPKAGDRITVAVAGAGPQTFTPTLSEHAAIELQSSRDAFFSINGTAVQRSSNQISDVISGVTFNLNAPAVPAAGVLTSLASADFSAVNATVINVATGAEDLSGAAIEDFVKAYNELLTFYKTESVSSTDADSRGVLNGDSTLRTFVERLRSLYTKGIRLSDGNSMSFSSIGVEVQRDGSLYLDKGKLNTAVSNGLQEKFASGVTVGYESSTSNFTSFITSALSTTGLLSSHIANAEKEQTALEKRVSEWQDKLTRVEQRYYRQYAALDALLFRLQTTSNALTSAIESLVNSQKSD
ncbi:MAG: flagellar filament capping protein FliD [Burkholderiaceae bacterium]